MFFPNLKGRRRRHPSSIRPDPACHSFNVLSAAQFRTPYAPSATADVRVHSRLSPLPPSVPPSLPPSLGGGGGARPHGFVMVRGCCPLSPFVDPGCGEAGDSPRSGRPSAPRSGERALRGYSAFSHPRVAPRPSWQHRTEPSYPSAAAEAPSQVVHPP